MLTTAAAKKKSQSSAQPVSAISVRERESTFLEITSNDAICSSDMYTLRASQTSQWNQIIKKKSQSSTVNGWPASQWNSSMDFKRRQIYLKTSKNQNHIANVAKKNCVAKATTFRMRSRITVPPKKHIYEVSDFRYFQYSDFDSQFSFQYFPLLQFCSLFLRAPRKTVRQQIFAQKREIYLAQHISNDIITRRRKRHINIYIFTSFSMVSVWLFFYHLCLLILV